MNNFTSQLLEGLSQYFGTYLADIQLIGKFNKGFLFLLWFSFWNLQKLWVVFLTYKKNITVTNAFKKTLDEATCKQNKVWVDKGY